MNATTAPVPSLWEVKSMRKYTTFSELESLLLIAIGLPGFGIKDIAAVTGIKANTLYKWKTMPVHLSPEKADKLLFYFQAYEPERLKMADILLQNK